MDIDMCPLEEAPLQLAKTHYILGISKDAASGFIFFVGFMSIILLLTYLLYDENLITWGGTPVAASSAAGGAAVIIQPQPEPCNAAPAESDSSVSAPLDAAFSRGFPDGEHSMTFADGSFYSGEWRDGKMHGRGVFVWHSGDRYEGTFAAGAQDGQGTFSAADGSTYFGGWAMGKMNGQGVFKPAPPASTVYLRRYVNGELAEEASLLVDLKHLKRKRLQTKELRRRAQAAEKARALQPGEVIYKGHHSYDLMRQLQMGVMYSIAQAGQEPSQDLTTADFAAEWVQYFPEAGDTPAFKWKDYAPRAFHRLRGLFSIDNADYLVSLTGGPALRELPSPGASGAIFFLSSDDRFLIKSVRKEEMTLLLGLVPKYYSHVAAHPDTLLTRMFGVHRVSPFLGRNARFFVMSNVLPTDLRMHRKFDLKGSTYKRTVGEERRAKNPNVVLKDLDLDIKFELDPERRATLLRQLTADTEFLESLHVIDYSLLMGVHFIEWGESTWIPPFADWPSSSASAAATASGIARLDPETPPFLRSPPKRSRSMAAGESLMHALEDLSCAGALEPALSRAAASVIASANSSRWAARASAKIAEEASAAASTDSSSTRGPSAAMQVRLVDSPPVRNLLLSFSATERDGSNAASPVTTQHERKRSGLGGRRAEEETGSGWAIPAVAVQRSSTAAVNRQPVLLYFGIIDFLQKYNTRKALERAWKSSLHGPSVSVADPHHYAQRFLRFLDQTFVTESAAN